MSAMGRRKKTLSDDFFERSDATLIPMVVHGSDGNWHIGTWVPVKPDDDPLTSADRDEDEVPHFVVSLLTHFKECIDIEIAEGRK